MWWGLGGVRGSMFCCCRRGGRGGGGEGKVEGVGKSYEGGTGGGDGGGVASAIPMLC